MASRSERTRKQQPRAPRPVDEESKLRGRGSAKKPLQLCVASEGTVNGLARSRSGSNEPSDDADIVEIGAQEEEEKGHAEVDKREKGIRREMKKKRSKEKGREVGCSVNSLTKDRSKKMDAILIIESDEEMEKVRERSDQAGIKQNRCKNRELRDAKAGDEERNKEKKKGKEKMKEMVAESCDDSLKIDFVTKNSYEKKKKGKEKVKEAVSKSSDNSLKTCSVARKSNKKKRERKQNVPVPCIAWRTRSFMQDRQRVVYTPYFEKVKVHSDISDSFSNSGSLDSEKAEEEDSESDSDLCTDSDAYSYSVSEPSSDSNKEEDETERRDTERRYLKHEAYHRKNRQAEKLLKKGHKRRRNNEFEFRRRSPVLDTEFSVSSSERNERAPQTEKRKIYEHNEMAGSPVHSFDTDEWDPLLEKEVEKDKDLGQAASRPVCSVGSEEVPSLEGKKMNENQLPVKNPLNPRGEAKRGPQVRKKIRKAKQEPPCIHMPGPSVKKKKKKKIIMHKTHGEGCCRPQLQYNDEWAPLVDLPMSSSNEADEKVERTIKKIKAEKEKQVVNEKQAGRSKPAKRKREKMPAKKDLLDYLMNKMDGETEEVLESSESEGSRNPPQELPLVFDFGSDDEPPVEKSEFEKFVDDAWQDFDRALAFEDLGTYDPDEVLTSY